MLAINVESKLSVANIAAFNDILFLNVSSITSVSIAWYIADESLGGTKIPLSPSKIVLRQPGISVVITGKPHAAAWHATWGKPSR